MHNTFEIRKIEDDVGQYFSDTLIKQYGNGKWDRDSLWTNAIQNSMAEIGHNHGFSVFASKSRCVNADGPEWLYDHHWRIKSQEFALVRIPLVMEIEWGYGATTIYKKISEDFLKLVQARSDLRVMVFQCNNVDSFTNKLITMAKQFEGTQQADRYFFAGWGWDTKQIHCRFWSS